MVPDVLTGKHWIDYTAFVKQQHGLFDILASPERMTRSYYENQKLVPRVGYCTNYFDRKWKISTDRK